MNSKGANIAATVCRVVLGLTLVFSGFVKTIDPWGTALKITEYLGVYGLDVLVGGRMAMAILFCAVELVLGLMLVFGIGTRLASLASLAMMSCFLVVTLLSATVAPVEDCGCFGDALHLSPWASLGKNVVLWVFALVVWLASRRGKPVFRFTARETVGTSLFVCIAVGLGVYCLSHLPLVDFLPFRVGVDLYDEKYIEEEERDISLMQFAVFDSEGDATHDILSFGGRVYMLCAARLDGIGPRCLEKFAYIARRAAGEGARVVLLTSSPISPGETATFGGADSVRVYNADATTMITMLRAPVGVVTLDGGVIVDKRNCRDIKKD